MTHMEVSRRTFIVASALAGGGMAIGFSSLANAAAINKQPWLNPTDKDGVEISQWLTIDPEGIVTIRVPHTEQGQGALTSVPMMIAEELQVDWKSVRAVFADANRHLRNNNEYVNMSTSGSNVVRSRHPHLMAAGASARERLKQAAANAWNVQRSDVMAKDGVLTSGTRRGTYAEFATAAAAVKLDVEPKIKTPDQWWLLGTSVQRLDIPSKVNGSYTYVHNVKVPGMLHGRVVRPKGQAAYGWTYDIDTLDPSSISHIPGAQVIRKGNFLGVVAPKEYDAIQAASDRKSTRLNSSHVKRSRMPSSA